MTHRLPKDEQEVNLSDNEGDRSLYTRSCTYERDGGAKRAAIKVNFSGVRKNQGTNAAHAIIYITC